MLNFKIIAPLSFFCSLNLFADITHRDAISAIPYIAHNASFQKLISYLNNNEKSPETVHVKLSLHERRQLLEKWRDGYYKNYTLPWLALHLAGDAIVGGSLALGLGLGCYAFNKNVVPGACVGAGVGGLLAAKNILFYLSGCVSSLQYKAESIDLQIARLENLLAVSKS